MTIQEAIREAGPGGRGKLRQLLWSFHLNHRRHITFLLDGNQILEIPLWVLDSTEWEVVKPEPEIEVGDIVRWGAPGEWTVLWLSDLSESNESCIQKENERPHFISQKHLTLIRKGPKRIVSEGVYWAKRDTWTVPMGYKREIDDIALENKGRGNGKRYRPQAK